MIVVVIVFQVLVFPAEPLFRFEERIGIDVIDHNAGQMRVFVLPDKTFQHRESQGRKSDQHKQVV